MQVSKEPVAKIVTLTPDMAAEFFEHNPVNRRLTPHVVDMLATDIQKGRFMFNGESIIISSKGELLDGQHRCAAVVKANKPVEVVLVSGISEKSRVTIDIGRARSAAQQLAMRGIDRPGLAATAVKLVFEWERYGRLPYQGGLISKAEIIKAVLSSGDVGKATEISSGGPSPRVLAFAYLILAKIPGNKRKAEAFIVKLATGDGLRAGSNILKCRNKLRGYDRGVTADTRARTIFDCWEQETGQKIEGGGDVEEVVEQPTTAEAKKE